jgi:hypothetical protein
VRLDPKRRAAEYSKTRNFNDSSRCNRESDLLSGATVRILEEIERARRSRLLGWPFEHIRASVSSDVHQLMAKDAEREACSGLVGLWENSLALVLSSRELSPVDDPPVGNCRGNF